ncbi:MAG: GGDEF domain-containing protein [Oscillospiraceae bacterium]|nr:GGDEF domain-containing protein [Oscillospiraceae bacterium]
MAQKFINKFLIASVLLSLIIGIIGVIYGIDTINIEKENCYKTLLSATDEACSKIESNFKNDRASLRMLSKVIVQSEDLESNEVNNQIGTYAVNNYITNIAILTEDNKILQSRHANVENTVISFEEEAAKGEHISNLQPSAFLKGKYVLRNYVPIGDRSVIKGLLFTELDVDALVKAWSPSIYEGEADFCIADRNTEEIVLNSSNYAYQTLADIQNESVRTGIKNKQEGYSETTLNNESYFITYKPMNIENWDFLIIVKSDSVLAPARKINTNLMYLMLAFLIIFILYLIWIMRCNLAAIKEAKENANKDALTGLLNRNSYEEYCSHYDSSEIKCIYIDVNGLHEINNEKGHMAGDKMLQFVADMLKEAFPNEKIFRIGGDEFLIFSQETLEELKTSMLKTGVEISACHYHISYGFAEGTDLKNVIKQAEILMYAMKKEYYERLGKEVRNKLDTAT